MLKTKVGQEVLGHVVSIYCPSGVSVDVGCQTLAFLEVEATAMKWSPLTRQEFGDGFPKSGPFRFQAGDEVHARVLDVNPSARP